MRVFKARIKAMTTLQNVDIPVAHAIDADSEDQMDKIIHEFLFKGHGKAKGT